MRSVKAFFARIFLQLSIALGEPRGVKIVNVQGDFSDSLKADKAEEIIVNIMVNNSDALSQ